MPNNESFSTLDKLIVQSVRDMEEQPVPDGFSARVMENLPSRKVSRWGRFRLWLTRPRSVTFRPVTAVPVVALAVILLVAALWPDAGRQPDYNGLSPVRFVLYDARRSAHSVAVMGSFNNWNSTSVMHYDPAAGAWVLDAELPEGEYEYVFVLDGERIVADPHAQMSRSDGFGHVNSVIYVGGGDEQML
ncbi:hypothetical protein [Pseudodesulfovibrio sp.]|uniref:hypothetical protein n=1 Tax=unclassified Pseudodesulfovibrio TaxID=2661612 RepID=UPI003AFFED35